MSAVPDDRQEGREAAGRASGDGAPARPAADLRAALRRARAEDAARSGAIADVRGVEIARLEVLQARLAPILEQVPEGIDLFDAALMPVPRPRLFIDMIGFVEMAIDRRRYRLVQDRNEGRVFLCETDRLDIITEAVTAYIARRLIEREKALAATSLVPLPPPVPHVPWWRLAGRLALEYLGIASLVVLLWVLGQALYLWAMSGR